MHRNPECLRDVRRILGYPPLLDMVWERMSIHVPLQQLADNIHAAEEDNDYQRPCACTRCREQHRSKAEDQREKKAVLNEQSQIGCSETERFAADVWEQVHAYW